MLDRYRWIFYCTYRRSCCDNFLLSHSYYLDPNNCISLYRKYTICSTNSHTFHTCKSFLHLKYILASHCNVSHSKRFQMHTRTWECLKIKEIWPEKSLQKRLKRFINVGKYMISHLAGEHITLITWNIQNKLFSFRKYTHE